MHTFWHHYHCLTSLYFWNPLRFSMKRIFSFLVLSCLFLLPNAEAQQGHNIEFEIKNYEYDTVLVAYYYGDRHLIQDTLISKNKKNFRLEGAKALNSGVYLMLTWPDKKFIQFMVNDLDQEFNIYVDAKDLSVVKFKGSEDNDAFFKYLDLIGDMRAKAATFREKLDALPEGDKKREKLEKELDKLDDRVSKEQNKLLQDHPEFITTMLVNANKPIDIPDFEGLDGDVKEKKYRYYKAHYFDNIELANPSSLRTPYFHTKIMDYLEKMTVQVPDSIAESMDYILKEVQPAEDTYRFYLSYFLNDAAKSKIVGYDAIYVHLMDNYYSKGLAPWSEEDNLKKLKQNAERLRPVLIGKKVDDITLYKEDGAEFKLSDVTSKYTVIMFWAPDCGHCKKAMPDAIAFNEKFKDRGVTFLAVCTKTKDKYQSCWDVLEEKNMLGFVNLGDQYGRSRFKSKFNVRTTPKIFILDEQREILMKNIGSKQLEEVMNHIMEQDSNPTTEN